MITVPQTQQILLSYFQTGSEPTSDQFAEFIGTMYYLFNETVNNAAAAAATATELLNALATQGVAAGAYVQYNFLTQQFSLQGNSVNIASMNIESNNEVFTVVINFTNALPNNFYKVFTASSNVTITSRTTAQIGFTFNQGFNFAADFSFVIFE